VHVIAGSRRLEVTGGGAGIVVHAGLVLLRQLADRTGLTGGLSRALASGRPLVHVRAGGVGADGGGGRWPRSLPAGRRQPARSWRR
jgi:hypothetical protein